MRATKLQRVGAFPTSAVPVSVSWIATIMTFVVAPIALILASTALGLSAKTYSPALDARAATTTVPMVVVWVNAGASGRDGNSGLSQSSPVKTIHRAMKVLEQFSALKGVIELDGTTTHDLGTNPTLDFFPLISQYGNVLIRGRRTDVHTGTVTETTTSAESASSTDHFTRFTSDVVTEDDYATHAIQNLNTQRFFAVESNTNVTVDVIGGQFISQDFAVIWNVGDSFEMFKVSSCVTWTGHVTVLASFSRVWIEAVHFLPANNVSQFVTPKYRDDAMIFHACHFTVKNTVAYDYGELSEAGFPLDADTRPLVRGSVHLEGCFLNGVGTVNATNIGAAFSTFEVDTKTVFLSVWSNATQMACTGMCTIVGYLGTSSPQIPILTSTGTFFGQGIKFRGTSLATGTSYLRVGTATSAKIRNIDLDVTGGLVGIFMDAHSFGEVSQVHVLAPTTVFGVRFGEGTRYRLYNSSITSALPLSGQFLVSLDIYGHLNLTGTANGTPAIELARQCAFHFNIQASKINHTDRGVQILHVDGGSDVVFSSPASLFEWETASPFPLIKVAGRSSVSVPTALVNLNVGNPNSTITCGANPMGPMATQTDFAVNVTQLCTCYGI